MGLENGHLLWRLRAKRVSSPMLQRIFPALISLFLAGFPTVFAADESTNKDGDWKLAVPDKDVEIYSRPHPGSPLKEFRAVGSIDAPTNAVCAVIDDFQNYPKFMQTRQRFNRGISTALAKSLCRSRLHAAGLEGIVAHA
ncbi:MAG: hypothetical protein DME79_01210 [Verrucomicrobia bacterium]|nr:MAG: hypothetical protein DME79_01210 [Verrucomicrobiota bacterium]